MDALAKQQCDNEHMALPESVLWNPEPHTAAKHLILRRYLGAWFPIFALAGRHTRVAYIDGFAGPGVYADGSPGSPIVALRTLLDHDAFHRLSRTTFVFIFVEQHPGRFLELQNQVETLWQAVEGGKPPNVVVRIVNDRFEDSAKEIVSGLGGKALIPTVAFVDPFGFSNVPIDVLCRLVASPRCEVLFSFMYDSVNRFVEHPNDQIHDHLHGLFGTATYRSAAELDTPAERRDFLHGLFRQQVAKFGRFPYVLDFQMMNKQGKNVYSLVYATRHMKGLEVMKDAMWAVDPSGTFRFSDRFDSQTSLFGEDPDVGPLREAIVNEFAGSSATMGRIREFVLAETIFGANHFKKRVLRPLQEEGLIVNVEGQKRYGTFPDAVVVHFAE